jgi:cytochrome b
MNVGGTPSINAETFLHQTPSGLQHKLRVWDLPTRLFHWLLVLAVVGMLVTGYLGALDWHMRLGCALFALLLFRLVWGLVGGHWSRFTTFFPSPRRIHAHLRKTPLDASADLGHNPLGGLSIWAMLLVLLAQVGSGLMSDDDIAYAGPWAQHVPEAVMYLMTDYHATIGPWLIMALVLLHLAAILFYLLWKRENLIGPMLHGDKSLTLMTSSPPSRDDLATRLLALVLLLVCLALVGWLTGFALAS